MLRTPVLVVNAIRVDGSIVACSRIARFLRDRFHWEVCDAASVALKHLAYRTVVMVNSPWGFCDEPHRARIREIVFQQRRPPRLVWVQNDYNSGIGPRSFKGMGAWLDGGGELTLWTTIADYVERGFVTPSIPLSPRSAYVNWNALHYDDVRVLPPRKQYRQRGELFYFGAFRPDRAARFKRFLDPSHYPVTISTAVGRSVERFRALLGPEVAIEAREQRLIDRLSSEWATVYIEDDRAQEVYVSPAGRFYEALAAGCCQFIDDDAVPTLEQAGFKVADRWVVRDATDVNLKMKLAPRFALEQREAWARPAIIRKFNAQLKEALSR